jgi:serine/threonine protein kinase
MCKHPNVVRILDAFMDDAGNAYLVYEFGGSDLSKMLAATSPSPNQVRDGMRQLFLGLRHIHGVGLVHCDLKPANLMVQECPGGGWFLRIGDLGNATEARLPTSLGHLTVKGPCEYFLQSRIQISGLGPNHEGKHDGRSPFRI